MGSHIVHAIVLWLAFIGCGAILYAISNVLVLPYLICHLVLVIIACMFLTPVAIQYFSWTKIVKDARHDSLTGLFNRSSFYEYFTKFIKRGEKFQLVMIDLCKFKDINDTYGHRMGDDVLKIAAKRIQAVLRPNDILARLGGDEFVVLLLGELTDAEYINLIKSVEEPMRISDVDLSISLSIGITTYPDDGIDRVTLMTQADGAMYHAKRNGISVFSGNLGDIPSNRERA